MYRARLFVPAVLLLAGLAGCTSARVVSLSQDGGVVAIPGNSNHWPFYYRDEAERVMAQKCPNGYEVVREEEVVVGKTQTTNESVDRQNPNGRNGQRTTTSVVSTTADQTEYRITFRARSMVPPGPVSPPASVIVPTTATVPASEGLPAGLPPRPVPVGAR